jgi:ubiquinone/menaquinone biosynthesis C-methylase UbiE
MIILEKFADYISKTNRAKKLRSFFSLAKPGKEDRILDVGVNNVEYSLNDNFLEKNYPYPQNITAVSREGLDKFKERYPQVSAIAADGRNLPFADNSFEIVYSNAVIEHVGGHEEQKVFLKELYRVARRGFITTPNRNFPIEIHTRVPLLHILLSKPVFDGFLALIGKKWATGSYMSLLDYKSLTGLLKESGIKEFKVAKNRFFGFTITFYVSWNKKD